jgi:uncharacterized protein YkwD
MFKLLAIGTIIFIVFNFFPSLPYNSGDVLTAINKVRIDNNLPAFEYYSILEDTASQKIDEIESTQKAEHGSNWSVKIKEKIPNYKVTGENMAQSYDDVESLVKAWLESPLHKKNILDKDYTKTGIAIKKINLNGKEQIAVVQHFLG